MSEIEMAIFDTILPTNTLAIINRIAEILRENRTNTVRALKGEALARVQALILILYEISDFHSWDVMKEWARVSECLKPDLIASCIKSER